MLIVEFDSISESTTTSSVLKALPFTLEPITPTVYLRAPITPTINAKHRTATAEQPLSPASLKTVSDTQLKREAKIEALS